MSEAASWKRDAPHAAIADATVKEPLFRTRHAANDDPLSNPKKTWWGDLLMLNRSAVRILITALMLPTGLSRLGAGEPPALNPFGRTSTEREDAVPGCVELSNGSKHYGMVYLTRDKRLQIYDTTVERQREIPLTAVKKIDCTVKREWLEKEWKFKETTSDEKMYTGRSYPAREYLHTITLNSGRTITGPLSAIVYVQHLQSSKAPSGAYQPQAESERFLLNKRNKGEMGETLKSLIYVKRIRLGKDVLEEASKGER
jgi:hypothetical protein